MREIRHHRREILAVKRNVARVGEKYAAYERNVCQRNVQLTVEIRLRRREIVAGKRNPVIVGEKCAV